MLNMVEGYLEGLRPAVWDGQGALHDGHRVDNLDYAAEGEGGSRPVLVPVCLCVAMRSGTSMSWRERGWDDRLQCPAVGLNRRQQWARVDSPLYVWVQMHGQRLAGWSNKQRQQKRGRRRAAHLKPFQARCPLSISCSSTPAEKMSTSGLSRPSLIISGDM